MDGKSSQSYVNIVCIILLILELYQFQQCEFLQQIIGILDPDMRYFTIMKSFSNLNFKRISNPTPDNQQFIIQLQKFCNKKILPLAKDVDLNDNFPSHLWKQMGQMGLLGANISTTYGGSQLGCTLHAHIMEQVSRCSGSIGLSYGVHSAVAMNQIYRCGNQKQKLQYIPKLCSGEFIGALAMSQPQAGSDVVSMRLTASKKQNKYILNGRKMWITNGPDADIVVVYGKTSLNGITAFLVQKGTKGFKVAQKLDKLGMRGSNTGQLMFDQAQIPEQNILGEIDKGVYDLMRGLDYQRLIFAAGPLGIMQSAFDISLQYAKNRRQFNKAIGQFQLIQAKLADMYAKLQSTRATLYSLTALYDKNQQISTLDCASVIWYSSKCGTEVALDAIQILGGNGYINDYPTGRFLRDAKLYQIGAGTQQIRLWLMGRRLMK